MTTSKTNRRSPRAFLFLPVMLAFAVLIVVSLVARGNSASADDRLADVRSAPSPEVISLQQAWQQGRAASVLRKQDTNPPADPGADREAASPNLQTFADSILPVLKRSCLDCHGPDHSEGRLRVDQLDPNLLTGDSVAQWREVYSVLSNSEMPPEGEEDYALSNEDRGQIVDWLSDELNKASRVRQSERPRSSFRRLARYEYDYALRDLLGLQHSLVDQLPPESTSDDGFRNNAELLQMSAMQFQTYRKIARTALSRACVTGDRPPPVTYVLSMPEELARVAAPEGAKTFDVHDDDSRGQVRRAHLVDQDSGLAIAYRAASPQPTDQLPGPPPEVSTVALVLPANNELKLNLDRFLPDEGRLKVRIRAARSDNELAGDACLQLSFSAHTSNNANFSNIVSDRDVRVPAAAAPQFVEFDISLGDIQRNPFRKLETKFPRRDEFLHIRNITPTSGLNVLIDYVEITAPYYEQWPPASHTAIFFESPDQSNESVYGREVLQRFVRRAWRRPVTNSELDRLMLLLESYRGEFDTFEAAMLEVLATVLVHPDFLYLASHEAEPSAAAVMTDHELASRLSAFLWASIPDDELLSLADKGRLQDPDVLTQQVGRMLADPKSKRFARHFVEQWLGLEGLDNTTHIKDRTLRQSMHDEPVAFFENALRHNRSIMEFLHSDYAVVNERLARHYGIRDVYGVAFREVPVTAGQHRGGLLTAAAVLAMNSDGQHSNPLKRGVWMLERVLHDPPPPPPPDVPEVDLTDPRILQMTLKERIADHRDNAACRSCHSRIDPWGIALENYDAMGAYRTKIGKEPVDASAELFDRQTLDGMDGLKRYLLLERQDQFTRAMVHKLAAYALGRSLTFGDRVELENIAGELRRQGDGLRDLIHLVIQSPLFHTL
ncbi:MAG: DUF1592 domain-containing protein [Planctomycetaceae bacterium]|nr:DUF1592 domain-containing protein [Planctomycetaceae bacterium]